MCLVWTSFSVGGISAFALYYKVFYPENQAPEIEEGLAASSWPVLEMAGYHSPVIPSEKRQDIILESYRDPLFRDEVEAFFSSMTRSPQIAMEILNQAEEFDIPPALAFALAWEESQYNPRAVSKKNANGTVDRGLFQLNDRSFPRLSEQEFFDPRTNSYYGMAHLRWCLDTGGSELVALAIYNAGSTRINGDQTPRKTLAYASRILEFKERIEESFRFEHFLREGFRVSYKPEPVEAANERKCELLQAALFPYRQ
ncbi:MAG: lytic transglycosylase domain-containing protein [Spirochaetaceae bacterium]|nr:lytic transglycosylase domain-containing protein [Spirochaetaceae bacterium]